MLKTTDGAFVGLPLSARLPIHAAVILLWAIVIAVFQAYGTLTIAGVFTEAANKCHPLHESANNIGGWSIAMSATLVPFALGWKFRKYVTTVWIILCAVLQVWFFMHNFLNWSECPV